MRETGTYQQSGDLRYFSPYALPPANPPLHLSTETVQLLNRATFALGELNEAGKRISSKTRFIKAYVIKEALLSSAIEGIHTTLIDVFTQPAEDTKPNKQTQLVLNYTLALERAVELMQTDGFPLASRVILAAHETLMTAGDGDKAAPGTYRKQSVRVGNLVPPLATEIPTLISQLEKYINEPSELAPLIRVGLVHLQFETIHPFLDGNGRIGRLLIVLMLMQEKLLAIPILYPSFY
jgi:Fic family protein